MNRRTIFLLIILLLLATTTIAFDGNRKGFVLGGGLGLGLVGDVEPELINSNSLGLAVNLYIGYALNEQDVIVIERNISVYDIGNRKLFSRQAIDAITWYHYWGEKGRSLFTAAGIGPYSYNICLSAENKSKLGFLVGLGYEFSKHWQAGLYLTKGKTESVFEFKHTTVSLIIGGVAF